MMCEGEEKKTRRASMRERKNKRKQYMHEGKEKIQMEGRGLRRKGDRKKIFFSPRKAKQAVYKVQLSKLKW